MIVELLGGPLDGDGAELGDEVSSIVLLQPSFAAFVDPSSTRTNGLPDGWEKVGEYVSDSYKGSPSTFSWYGEE